ncbi:unnamed protein product [Albugo candida]|uniref:Protein kinase domain-containing protein n=1 Tax=Albugo candida TaxID=65357 RepID=A0A024FV72_9STRA|nr:unnamed protein product [Albugo candida]|eukprot:CCI11000.1 unnamed protein product [Albugo candida]
MKIPKAFVPWNIDAHRKGGGLVALRRKHVELAICRCGLVLAGTYAPIKQETLKQIPVALKVMDKGQITQQHDDVENELRIMSQLQMGGVEAPLSNPYVIRWEYSEDAYNDYIATEFVSNGSFLLYAHKKIRELMVKHLRQFAVKNLDRSPTKFECISYVYRPAGNDWMRESVQIFTRLMQGLTYLHAQNVAHLDLDVYNIAIDRQGAPRIIDYGSSQISDHRGIVGAGHLSIKFKPAFVAPEVRNHSRMPAPRKGFDGAKADIWSAGVVLVQCIVWGFRGGSSYLSSHPSWRKEVFEHIENTCFCQSCYFCINFISIPPLIAILIQQMLQEDPKKRPSAYDVAMVLLKAVSVPFYSQERLEKLIRHPRNVDRPASVQSMVAREY